MLSQPKVQRYAVESGLRDIMIAEKEVVLTFLLQLLSEHGILDRFAFKGGTCLRKMVINPTYAHDWNGSGESEIRIQISRRETPTLAPERRPQYQQSYFGLLPFAPADITCLALPEIIAEKIRACYQRNKARDIYDLGAFAARPLDQTLIRRLVVLKLWQARDTFDPELLLRKFEDGRSFDWDDLNQLVRRTIAVDPQRITADCIRGYRFLLDLTEEERQLANDPHQRQRGLWQTLRTAIGH